MDAKMRLTEKFRLTSSQLLSLKKLKIETIEDILRYFPVRYSSIREQHLIKELNSGEDATIFGTIRNLKSKKSFRGGVPMGEAVVEDQSGKIKVVWFNQVFLVKTIKEGSIVRLSGKITSNKNGLSLINPEVEVLPELPIDTHNSLFQGDTNHDIMYPVYRETKGVTSKFLFHAVRKIFLEKIHETIIDPIPSEILERYKLPKLSTAFVWIHSPRSEKEATASRKRFAFEEVFMIQLAKQREKFRLTKLESEKIKVDKKELETFIKRFPFEMTKGQKNSINTIVDDFTKNSPMSRLLEGDVGSGKTAVAASVSYSVVTSNPGGKNFGNLQVAYMAPTEILATQHFESFISFFKHMPIQIGLITSSGCKKFPSKINPNGWTDISRTQLLKWVANGEIPILIGTHSLIQKTVNFKHLSLVIIDEQHRFGTKQRMLLTKKENSKYVPHLLSMTATPIPRTLALTIYGDLDLSILDEQPKGRLPVITEIVKPNKRDAVYEKIRKELIAGRQAYIICPRIDDPDPEKEMALILKSVSSEAARLKKNVFPEYTIGILHSKLTKDKKEEVMENFAEGKIDILIATSVVEVGVNVPNATSIIIEGAERFGLAQLHQLRGRVQRSTHQPYCYLFTDSSNEKTAERLKAISTAKNGFELAEMDLVLRGAGELGGGKQWGITDIGMEAIKNLKMVEAARNEAKDLIAQDPEIEKHPLLKIKVDVRESMSHFE